MAYCPRCRLAYSIPMELCLADGERLIDDGTDPLLGQVIDRYRVIQRLGAGSMGSVYRAEHTVLGRSYALKVLHGEMAARATAAARFRREAQAAGKMQHRNIIAVSDSGTTPEGLSFMVMELLEGKTLERILEEEGSLERGRIIELSRQVAAGLEAAHRLGYVHRDLKPANVMVVRTAQLEVAKILDFGLVGVVEEDLEVATTRLTARGLTVGTPVYMAPEQARDPQVSPRADLYALGVMMYEMLGGRPPFLGSMSEILLKHQLEPPPPLPGPRGPLEQLTLDLLQKDPDDRPASTRAVTAALDRIALGPDPAVSSGTRGRGAARGPSEEITIPVDSAPPPARAEQRSSAAPASIPTRRRPPWRPAVATAAAAVAVAALAFAFVANREPGEILLSVSSEPRGARVTIDGMELGVTPFARHLPVPGSGRIAVQVQADGYQPWSRDVRIEASGEVTLDASLRPLPPP